VLECGACIELRSARVYGTTHRAELPIARVRTEKSTHRAELCARVRAKKGCLIELVAETRTATLSLIWLSKSKWDAESEVLLVRSLVF
jgi:hypothetical protein